MSGTGCLYVVRCNFADPASVEEWERWYSTEKQDWLLSRPGFLAGQRFSATRSSDGVDFLALYALESPQALQTPEYRSGWGWGEWRPHIVDWTRDLVGGVDPDLFLTRDDELLRVLFVKPTGDAERAAAEHPDLHWTAASPGLDASLLALGLARTPTDDGAMDPAPGTADSLFRPASPTRYSA